MFKKVFTLMMLALVAVPSFALADWQITASATPAGLGVTAVPTTTSGGFTNFSTSHRLYGKLVRVTDATNPVSFTLGTTPPGYTLTSVTIDGARVDVGGPFNVSKGTMTNHTIVANYKLYATNTYSIKSIAAAGGSI